MGIRIVDRYQMTPDRFWNEVFFDPDFTQGLYRDGLGYGDCEVLSESVDAQGNRERTLKVYPKLDMPGPVRKILGGRFYYEERGEYDAQRRRWVAVLTIPRVGDRLSLTTTMWLEDRPDGCSDRFAQIDVNIRIFGLRGLFERFAEKSLREGYVKATKYTNEY